MEARVLVTERLRPIRLDGRTFHQVGIPYHWGSKGLDARHSANELLALLADANVTIMHSKAMTCCLSPGRVAHERHRETALGPRMPDASLRDLPQAQHRPKGKHGVVAGQSKQGEQT